MHAKNLPIKMQMDHKQVCKEIDKINQYLGKYQWMDFRYGYIGEDKIYKSVPKLVLIVY